MERPAHIAMQPSDNAFTLACQEFSAHAVAWIASASPEILHVPNTFCPTRPGSASALITLRVQPLQGGRAGPLSCANAPRKVVTIYIDRLT